MKFLKKGDTVALVAPSSPVSDLDSAVSAVRCMGLFPVVYPSCLKSRGYLAGSDEIRARDLMDAFADGIIDGIICARGGYGAQRILPLLDWDIIRRNPKPFYGYSDISALHTELNKLGHVTWHSPMPATEWKKGLDSFTEASLRAALFGPMPAEISQGLAAVRPGVCEGALCGGNLTVISASLGTPYELDTCGKILFIEDVDEQPRAIDRMLYQLKLAGKFDDAAGVIFGQFVGAKPKGGAPSLTVDEIIDDMDIGVPCVKGLRCGHEMPTISLPLGAVARLDADLGTLRILGV